MNGVRQIAIHVKARFERPEIYPQRFPVPDDRVYWRASYIRYQPPYFVAPVVLQNDEMVNQKGWADPEDFSAIKRRLTSYEHQLFDNKGLPLNPMGRTGISPETL